MTKKNFERLVLALFLAGMFGFVLYLTWPLWCSAG